MDADIIHRNSKGKKAKQLILLPDADISEPENESDSDFEVQSSSDNENSDSEDDTPLEDEIPLANLAAVSKGQYRWLKRNPIPQNREFLLNLPNPPIDEWYLIQYFNEFFTIDMFEDIALQSILYSIQSNSIFRTTRSEIEIYCGILLMMGIVVMPRCDQCWSNETRFSPIADNISRDRFHEITRYIHFNDNNLLVLNRDDPQYDRLYKVRPLLDKLRAQFLKIDAEEKQSVDEQMIPFNGKKNKLRVYLPKKPKKWGFKVFSHCGVSGIVYDFYVYDGRRIELTGGTGDASADTVLKLCITLPNDCNFKLYFDNYFTTFDFQRKLKERGI